MLSCGSAKVSQYPTAIALLISRGNEKGKDMNKGEDALNNEFIRPVVRYGTEEEHSRL